MSVGTVWLVGRYRLIAQLGAGGMGRVWLAEDDVLHREVAIKEIILPEGLAADECEEIRQLTLREAQAAARLSHPNVVSVYDVLLTNDRPWIVMEYVQARSLVQILRENGAMSPERVAEIGLAVLEGLRAAHAAGVLHRDVKPGNVLLADDGRVVLTDFGLAVFTSGEGALTNPGLVRGSPQFMSPERARDGVSTPESDLWSLGATLYTAVEGRAPYARETLTATLTALATQPPDPAPQAGPLKPVLDGLLRRNPARRMTAEAVEQALWSILSGGPRATRRWRRRLVIALVLAVLAVPSAALAYQARDAVPDPPATMLPPLGSTAPDGVPDVDGVGVPECPPPTGPVPVPAAQGAHEYALLPGWVWYDDPSGFSIAVPAGWSYNGDGSTVCFGEPGDEPGGGRMLAVGRLPEAGEDLVGFWARQEEELEAAGRLPGYQQVALTERDYHLAAADWELAYDADGVRRHAIARSFRTAAGEAYAIHWITPEFDWQVNRDYFDLVIASFTPAAP